MSGVDHRDRNNTGLERSELNLLFTAQVVLQTAMPIAYPMIPPWANLYFACFVFPPGSRSYRGSMHFFIDKATGIPQYLGCDQVSPQQVGFPRSQWTPGMKIFKEELECPQRKKLPRRKRKSNSSRSQVSAI